MTSILVIGATGMFGQAFMAEAARRGSQAIGAARRGSDIEMDIGDDADIERTISSVRPDIVVNTAALIDIDQCEARPAEAWRINARAAGRVAEIAGIYDAQSVHISTDHFYTGAGAQTHHEDDPVVFVNEYARTKFAGEELVLATNGALVIRTNILGFRGWENPTFTEWVLATILEDRPATLFDDSYISAIDVGAAARAILDLADVGAAGILNVGCREVYSKKDFFYRMAARLGRTLTKAQSGSISELKVRRAESLGLDVSQAEKMLGRQMPRLDDVLGGLIEAGADRHAI